MNDNQQKLLYSLRAIMSSVFLLMVGGVFLYSQFTDKPISLEVVGGLLVILIPYFGLDTVASVGQIKSGKYKD